MNSGNVAPAGLAKARAGFSNAASCVTSVALYAFVAVLAALVLAVAAPGQAHANGYTMPKVEISASVQPDGTLEAQEHRTFDFDGSFTCVWWTFEGFPEGSQFLVDGVSMSRSDSSDTVKLEEVPFQTQWRDSGGPGRTCYSVDEANDSVYVFFDATDVSIEVQFMYSVTNAVQVYDDVAELYWKYVGSQWAESSDDIACSLTLPRPSDEAVVAGENVRMWAHGPLDGSVAVDENGTVRCAVPKVPAGEFAELRTTFPKDWLSGVDDAVVHHYEALPGILSEEQKWADEANAKRGGAWLFIAACVVVALALIAWALVMFLRYGKEYKAQFAEDYWRDVPDPDAQPAEIGRLWRRDKHNPRDFTATVMRLAHLGAVRMEKGSYADAGGHVVEDYRIVKVPEVADAITEQSDPIGRCVLDMLFDTFLTGDSAATSSAKPHVWFGTISRYGKAHPQQFSDAMDRFQAVLSQGVDSLGYFEAKGSLLKMTMAAIAVVALLAGIAVGMFAENFVPAIAGMVAGGVLFVISIFMTRMTHRGAEVRAKATALKKWLEDFSALDERPPTDVKVWGEFMVYAYEFGIAEQVMRELRLKVPDIFVDEGADSTYLPWWFWYSPHYSHGASGSLANVLSNTVDNTVNTVSTALSQSSSGAGFGGGFSMGGGGGFGGGGGGAR